MADTKPISKESQAVLALALAESERLRCDHVASEHLLLGLMAYGKGRGAAGRRDHAGAVGSAGWRNNQAARRRLEEPIRPPRRRKTARQEDRLGQRGRTNGP